MSNIKLASLILITIALILMVIGSMYNPNSVVLNLKSGEIQAFEFSMHTDEIHTFKFSGTDRFTVYLMNESEYNNMERSNFTNSIWSNTTASSIVTFRAPQTGNYYFVIANVNSLHSIQVKVIYGSFNGIYLLLIGFALGLFAGGLAIYEGLKNRERKVVYDSKCPWCGAPVDSSWHYCANCGHELEGPQ